jgi:Xaa-Pro aminopeptidase
MTRTIVKGKASDKVRKMFNAVLEARNASIDAVQDGALGSDVYDVCCDVLEKAGYETTRGGKQITRGLTHSLGHGVGLDIHEFPRMSELYKFPLKEHNIVMQQLDENGDTPRSLEIRERESKHHSLFAMFQIVAP